MSKEPDGWEDAVREENERRERATHFPHGYIEQSIPAVEEPSGREEDLRKEKRAQRKIPKRNRRIQVAKEIPVS